MSTSPKFLGNSICWNFDIFPWNVTWTGNQHLFWKSQENMGRGTFKLAQGCKENILVQTHKCPLLIMGLHIFETKLCYLFISGCRTDIILHKFQEVTEFVQIRPKKHIFHGKILHSLQSVHCRPLFVIGKLSN